MNRSRATNEGGPALRGNAAMESTPQVEGSRGESEVIRCAKGHWHIYGIESQEKSFRQCIAKATTCPDYDDTEGE